MTARLEQEILSRGLDDIIQLAEIVSVARFNLGIEEGPDLFAAVEDCFRALVGGRLAIVGDLDDSGSPLVIRPWSGKRRCHSPACDSGLEGARSSSEPSGNLLA